MKKFLLLILLSAVIILTSCASERIIFITQTVNQTQTQTITSVRTITLQPTAIPPESPPTITETTFSPITFSGSGSEKTPPFTVTTNEWIIDWSYVPSPEFPDLAVFGFFIYPRGETIFSVESVLFPSSTSSSTYSYAGSGEYYLDITSANVSSWTITIRPA